MNPEISVLMSTYKEKSDILKQSIESILGQTYRNFEFIIILDCPENDENKKIIQSYAEKDERIKFHINEKNLGLTASLNKALSLASGKYIARMDADDISLPERFELQKKFIEENSCDFIGGFVTTINSDGQVIQPVMKAPVKHDKILKALKFNDCIYHPTWFVKKEVFDTVGNYEGKFVEDYNFVLRAMEKGKKFGNLDNVVLKYRMGKESISRTNLFKQYLSACYLQKKFCRKNIRDISIEEYIEMEFSEKKAEKYASAASALTEGLEFFHEKKFLKSFMLLTKSLTTSRYYTEKILRYALINFI